jgi:hypothetical protein
LAQDVIINDLGTSDVSRIIFELKEQGLEINKDFDFYYHQPQTPRWDDEHGKFVRKHTRFIFYQDKWATWFSLKYSHKGG